MGKIDIEFLAKRGFSAPKSYAIEICARSFEEAAAYTVKMFGLSESVEAIIREWNDMALYEYTNNVRLMPYE